MEIDPDWELFSDMVKLAAQGVKTENPGILRVLGGISHIDPSFIKKLQGHGVLNDMDVVAVHEFPLDWNLNNGCFPGKRTISKTIQMDQIGFMFFF